MTLRVPFVHELVGFSVFRARTMEDGRERYRLHVGYFNSPARAHEALSVVRRYFPGAWISVAPRASLGSLDDTMNSSFQTVRRATARVVAREDLLPPSVAKSLAADPEAYSAGDPPVGAGPQRYAVQLDASLTPISADDIPRLAIFRAYNLYRVRAPGEGGIQHSLRLGFFQSVINARQVAEYLRSQFAMASVVPVSYREYALAVEVARQVADQANENEKSLRASQADDYSPRQGVDGPPSASPTAPDSPDPADIEVSPVRTRNF
jgi:hypothetical protein